MAPNLTTDAIICHFNGLLLHFASEIIPLQFFYWLFNSQPNGLSWLFSTHSIQATWDPLMFLITTEKFKTGWGGNLITVLLTACNVPSVTAHSTRHLHVARKSPALQNGLHQFSSIDPLHWHYQNFPIGLFSLTVRKLCPAINSMLQDVNTSTAGRVMRMSNLVVDTAAEMIHHPAPSQSTSPHESYWLNSLLTWMLWHYRIREMALGYAGKDKLVILSIKS